jgi:hypothetical protein
MGWRNQLTRRFGGVLRASGTAVMLRIPELARRIFVSFDDLWSRRFTSALLARLGEEHGRRYICRMVLLDLVPT